MFLGLVKMRLILLINTFSQQELGLSISDPVPLNSNEMIGFAGKVFAASSNSGPDWENIHLLNPPRFLYFLHRSLDEGRRINGNYLAFLQLSH